MANRPLTAQESFDPGLTQQYGGKLRRAINKDGSFNVHRTGTRWRDANLYSYLVQITWRRFLGIILAAYFVINVLFAGLYCLVGVRHLTGSDVATPFRGFVSAFFFSTQTLTTVGYGAIAPSGIATNSIASFEALLGLMAFAVATGLLVGRVSRPSARIAFSEKVIVARYQGGTSLQFRIANQRSNSLMELDAKVLLMTVDDTAEGLKRDFVPLTLERNHVYFFPLTWTLVHPIDEKSPLWGKTAEDWERLQAELLILIKGFDETFSQTVHVRYSYTHDELLWGAKFASAFRVSPEGDLVLQVDRVGAIQEELPG